MKLAFLPFLCIGWCLSCTSNDNASAAEQAADAGYTLTGAIDGLDSGWVYLLNREQSPAAPDSALIINGNFLFQGSLTEPTLFSLGVPNNGAREYHLGFFLDNGQIHISGKREAIADAQVTGSPVQDEYRKYLERRRPLDEERELLRKRSTAMVKRKNKKELDSLERALRTNEQKDRVFVSQYALQHPGSCIAAMAVYEKFADDTDPAPLAALYRHFDSAIQRSYFGKKIGNLLTIARKTAVGSSAPWFTESDINGKPVSLSSFRGTYILLDFWASWSAAYRTDIPYRTRAYRKYHARGFEILGVSLDTAKAAWMGAIRQDKLRWTQIGDLRGWEGAVVKLYGVHSVPANFLIDREGKIIARNISASALETFLREQLK